LHVPKFGPALGGGNDGGIWFAWHFRGFSQLLPYMAKVEGDEHKPEEGAERAAREWIASKKACGQGEES